MRDDSSNKDDEWPEKGKRLLQNEAEDPLAENWVRRADEFTSGQIMRSSMIPSKPVESSWLPLAALIEQLPRLSVVKYDCKQEIPWSICSLLCKVTPIRRSGLGWKADLLWSPAAKREVFKVNSSKVHYHAL